MRLGLVLLGALAAGCRAGTTPPVAPTAAAQPAAPADPAAPGAEVTGPDGSRFIAGDAVVVLAPGASPPAMAGRFRCAEGAWSGPRVLLVRCAPAPDAAATRSLIDALRCTPGVESADFNFVRQRLH